MLNLSILDRPSASLPTDHGEFQIYSYPSEYSDFPHVLLIPKMIQYQEPPLLRIHSECLTGDVFASRRCDCGFQLAKSMEMIGAQGGILIYLRQEGRGIGLSNKIQAYALQDKGLDTVEANHELGFETDSRSYKTAIDILNELQVSTVRLITNNPLKINYLKNFNIEVKEVIQLVKPTDQFNEFYLQTKKEKLGHLMP